MMERLDNFLEDYRSGMYTSLPKFMYNLVILAAKEAKKRQVVVNQYSRPTDLERVIARYKITGIRVKLEECIDIFERRYTITISPETFLNSIFSRFYGTTTKELEDKYPIKVKYRTVSEEIRDRLNGNYGKNAVVIFRRKIG